MKESLTLKLQFVNIQAIDNIKKLKLQQRTTKIIKLNTLNDRNDFKNID